MGGTLEYFSGLLSSGHDHEHKKQQHLQTVELKVRMDCEGCELKVKKALSSMKGAHDKKAPPGYLRSVESVAVSSIQASKQDDQMANMFSDDNPNSCSII